MSKQPWAERWEDVGEIGSGGGGHGMTRRVRDLSGGPDAVLKILKQQKEMERRKRMHREVAALQTLACRGVPRLIDANTDQFAVPDARLYLVTELIEGPTLETHVTGRGPLDVADSLMVARSLLDTVIECHRSGVLHRDIKPDNIVLRHGSVADPVLLDFGQSFNDEMRADLSTAAEQQLGNRFLELPELRTLAGDARDPRSDVTSCVGILLYCLTARLPRTLLDEAERLPHQREEEQNLLARIMEPIATELRSFFDIGFQLRVDRRWQSATAAREALEATNLERPGSRPGAPRLEEALSRLHARSGGLSDASKILRQRLAAVRSGAGDAAAVPNVYGTFGLVQANETVKPAAHEATTEYGFSWMADPRLEFVRRIRVSLTGSEVIVAATSHTGSEVPLGRLPAANAAEHLDTVRQAVSQFLLDELAIAVDRFAARRE